MSGHWLSHDTKTNETDIGFAHKNNCSELFMSLIASGVFREHL